MKLILPYPVSLNQMNKNVRGKGRIKTDKYKAWLNEAGWELVRQLSALSSSERKIRGKFTYSCRPLRPDNRIRDLDNLSKVVLDLLVRHQIVDADHLTEEIDKRWRYDGPPGIAIRIEPFNKGEESFDEWWNG